MDEDHLSDLIDQPNNGATHVRLFAATAGALMKWETRLRLSRVQIFMTETPGQAVLDQDIVLVAQLLDGLNWAVPQVSMLGDDPEAGADPDTSRPPAMMSVVAAILASTAGGRIRLLVTITPSPSLVVCAASAASRVHASSASARASARSGTM